MSIINKEHLSLTLQIIKTLLSFKADKAEMDKKLDKKDHYTDEEMMEFISETVNITPVTENGKLLVEGNAYLVV